MRYVLIVVSKEHLDFEWTEEWPYLVISAEAAAAQVQDGDLVGTSLPEPTAFLFARASILTPAPACRSSVASTQQLSPESHKRMQFSCE